MTTPKLPRNTSLLTPTQAADRLVPLLSNLSTRIETARDEAEMTERQRTAEQWRKIIVRVEEADRPRILKVLEALGVDCCGLTLEIANDTPSRSDDVDGPVEDGMGGAPGPDTSWLNEAPRPTAKPIEIDRDERKTGAQRK